MHRFPPLGHAVSATQPEARNDKLTCGGLLKRRPTAFGVGPVSSRTSCWHQRPTLLGHAVLTTCLAPALPLATLRKRRRQRRGSNPRPCGQYLVIAPVHPPVKLSCWRVARHRPTILKSIHGKCMCDCGGDPRPRPCGLAVGATAQGQATHLSCTIARSPAEPAPFQLNGCHMRFRPFRPPSCERNAAHWRGTRTRHRADKSLATAGFRPTLSWVVASSRRPSALGKACAAKRRIPRPPVWTSGSTGRTRGNCGGRKHALVDGRPQQPPYTTSAKLS